MSRTAGVCDAALSTTSRWFELQHCLSGECPVTLLCSVSVSQSPAAGIAWRDLTHEGICVDCHKLKAVRFWMSLCTSISCGAGQGCRHKQKLSSTVEFCTDCVFLTKG